MTKNATIIALPQRYDYSDYAKFGANGARALAALMSTDDVVYFKVGEEIQSFNTVLFAMAVDEGLSVRRMAWATTLPVPFITAWRNQAGV